jgi:site-specific recombinase XerD
MYVRERVVRGEFVRRTARNHSYILHDLATFFGARPINRFNIGSIDDWFESMTIAPTTRRVRLGAVTGFSRWLHKTGRIKVDPTYDYPRVSLPRRVPITVPDADVRKLLDLVGGDARARVMVWLMVGMGCRCVGVSNLNLDDYDADARTLRLVGKGGHERMLPVPVNVGEVIDAYLDEVGRVVGPLIRGRKPNSKTPTHKRLSPSTVSDYLGRWMDAAGIKARSYDGKSAHGLRRTAATDVMERTRDIHAVQAMLGHARIETTTIYLRPVSLDRLREAMEGRTYEDDPAA